MKQILSWNDEKNQYEVRYATKEEEATIKMLTESMKKIKSLEQHGLSPETTPEEYREVRDAQHRLIEKVRDLSAGLISFNYKQYKLQ